MQSQQTASAHQTINPLPPINPETVMQRGDSSTSTILAVTILIATLMGSITSFVQVMLWGMSRHSKT